MPTRVISRRKFLKKSAFLAALNVVPGSVLGLKGATTPSERLNIAGVGLGGQGGHDISQFKNHNIIALCDVDSDHDAGTFKQFPKAKVYKDFRRMLEKEKEIEAVVVATPDHLHAFASMMAIKMGK